LRIEGDIQFSFW